MTNGSILLPYQEEKNRSVSSYEVDIFTFNRIFLCFYLIMNYKQNKTLSCYNVMRASNIFMFETKWKKKLFLDKLSEFTFLYFHR